MAKLEVSQLHKIIIYSYCGMHAASTSWEFLLRNPKELDRIISSDYA